MSRPGRMHPVILLTLILLVGMAVVSAIYTRTRPPLAPRRTNEWLKQVTDLVNQEEEEPRAVVAGVREFFLDHPLIQEPRLRLGLAASIAAQPPPDDLFVIHEMESVGQMALSKVSPHEAPKEHYFTDLGFDFERYFYRGPNGWPKPFLMADFDGDGRPDVALEYCGISMLFRHTAQGWESDCFEIGLPVMGMWAVPITRNGPTMLLVASLLSNAYDPDLLLSGFVYRHGRLENVLSTLIQHGWQFEHKDLDGDGVEEIRTYETWAADFGNIPLRRVTTFKWDGQKFTPVRTVESPPDSGKLSAQRGEESFRQGHSGEAIPALQSAHIGASHEDLALELNRIEALLFTERTYDKVLTYLTQFEEQVRASDLSAESKSDLLLEDFYHQALCARKMGESRQAAVIYSALWRSDPKSNWGRLAKQWLTSF